MTRQPVKSLLKDKLSRENLSDEEYARLEKLMQNHQRNPVFTWYRRPQIGIALAACLLLVVVLLMRSTYFSPSSPADTSNVQLVPAAEDMLVSHPSAARIAKEVLTNHIYIKQMDIETDSIEVVRTNFDRLDFALQISNLMSQDILTLLGARYCTLQGFIATQLLFQTPNGEKVTHYQAAYDETRFGPLPDISLQQPPIILAERGYTVEIWREAGLVMARAQAAL